MRLKVASPLMCSVWDTSEARELADDRHNSNENVRREADLDRVHVALLK